MMPDPLHPAVVHLPLAIATILPFLAALGAWAVWRELLPVRAWAVIVLLQALVVGGAWLATETGESEEDRVERVVAERHIEAHEHAAERFLLLAGIALVPIGAGMLAGRRGTALRVAGVIAALGVLGAAIPVGHSGGELVYTHGAAAAYTAADAQAGAAGAVAAYHGAHDDDEDSDD